MQLLLCPLHIPGPQWEAPGPEQPPYGAHSSLAEEAREEALFPSAPQARGCGFFSTISVQGHPPRVWEGSCRTWEPPYGASSILEQQREEEATWLQDCSEWTSYFFALHSLLQDWSAHCGEATQLLWLLPKSWRKQSRAQQRQSPPACYSPKAMSFSLPSTVPQEGSQQEKQVSHLQPMLRGSVDWGQRE